MSVVAALFASTPALAQQGRIAGRVTAAEGGLPVVGAQVVVTGTTRGTLTREDGRYTLAVPAGTYAVRVARVGFRPDTVSGVVVRADSTTSVDFQLQQAAAVLSGVVVVGYGQQQARDVTGVTATVDSTTFNTGRVISPEGLIQGKIAGVQVIENNEPGGGPTVRIRGGTSVTASNDPLYVVDGVPLAVGGGASIGRNPLNFINPTDIESITVLKDASATAIYGSRGANGVVIITTKSGASGPQFTYQGTVSGSRVVGGPDFVNASQYRAAVQQYASSNVALLGSANSNWLDAIERNAGGQEHNVGFNGHREDMNIRLGLGYLNQSGVLNGTNVERFSGTVNYGDRILNDKLSLRAHLKGARTKDVFTPSSVFGNAAAFAPTQPIYNSDGTFYEYRRLSDGTLINQAPNNPLAELSSIQDAGSTLRSVGNVEAEYQMPFLRGLSATVRTGYDIVRGDRTTFVPSTLTSQLKGDSAHRGSFYRNSPEEQHTVLDAYATFQREVNELVTNLNITGGYSTERARGDYGSVTLTGISTDLLGSYGAPQSSALQIPSYNVDEYRLVSGFGRANLSLLDRYLFTGTVRRDGSSRFAIGNQYGTFPSAAFAWRVLDEPMLKDRHIPLSDLKFRLSWGKNGNQSVGNYLAYTSYSYGQSTVETQLGNIFVPTIRPGASDPKLRWETTTSTDVGLDYGFMNGRFSGSVDYYNKKTTDLLFKVPTAAGTALSNFITTNIGSVQNRGFELSLDAHLIDGGRRKGAFTWDANFNASTNKNELLSIDRPGVTAIRAGDIAGGVGTQIQVLQPGYAINSFYVYHQIGDTSGVPIYEDRNGDKIINEKDLRPFHSPAPTWVFGFTSNFQWRGFDASTTLRAYTGNYVYNNVASNLGHYSVLTGAAPVALQASALKTGFINPQYFSDIYVEKASFLRMDNLTLGYTFEQMRSLSNARLFGTIQNVFTSTGYSGVDPTAGANGIDNNLYPRSRTYLGGVSLGF